jgi:hypothetical protein
MMEALISSKTSALKKATQLNIPEDAMQLPVEVFTGSKAIPKQFAATKNNSYELSEYS